MIIAKEVNKIAKEVYECEEIRKEYWADWNEPEDWDKKDTPPEESKPEQS